MNSSSKVKKKQKENALVDGSIESRVLDAVQELLADRTASALKLPDVAKKARVGLDTIYRRWRTKADLLHAAVSAQMQGAEGPNPTGSLREQLVAGLVFGSEKIMTGRTGGLIRATVIEALQPGGEQWQKLLEEEQAERRAQTLPLIEQGIERGELPENTNPDELLDLLAGVLWFQAIVYNHTVTRKEAEKIVDRVLQAFS